MKVTIYTTNDCAFCKQEKDYLASKNIAFEEKNVQSNRAFLQEMLDVSNNFAGTPVTKIDKDDGQSVILKGFTQSELENALGANMQSANSTIPASNASQSDAGGPTDAPTSSPSDNQGSQTPSDQPTADMPVVPPTPDPVVPEPQTPAEETPTPEPTPPQPQEPQVPVEAPVSETPQTDVPSDPNPLPPQPMSDVQTPAQDDSVAEMQSTIPTNQTPQDDSSNDTTTDMPPTTDQPVETPTETPTPSEPAIPDMPPLESPAGDLPTEAPPIETPPTQPQPNPVSTPEPSAEQPINSDQKLDEILNSLKTQSEASAGEKPAVPDFPGTTQTS